MSFSRLLLLAASSRKQISGAGSDKIVVNPRRVSSGSHHDPYAGEVILCFEIDDRAAKERKISQNLGMQDTDKRCDGIIFYSQDESEDRVICLVEMKSTQVNDVAEQIISTRNHLKALLQADCGEYCNRQLQHIKWKACFYHHGVSQNEIAAILNRLRNNGLADSASFTVGNNDVGPFLRGEEDGARGRVKMIRGKRK